MSRHPKREQEPEPPPESLIEVACCVRQDQAEERGLVILAMGLPYWIVSNDGVYSVMVMIEDGAAASAELRKFDEERRLEREQTRRELEAAWDEPPRQTHRTTLWVYGWALCAFFALQAHFVTGPVPWMMKGEADSTAIINGQWWRTLTALTLHADFGHLIANVAVGMIFAGALLPYLGSGWTWLGIVLSGALGNWLNALGHHAAGETHLSIGASTAVFGGLGILVGWQIVGVVRHHGEQKADHQLIRRVWFPIAAGLALLAYLGSGSEGQHVDFMAHLFGMLAGGLLGIFMASARLPQRTSPRWQVALGLLALLLPCTAWVFAMRGR